MVMRQRLDQRQVQKLILAPALQQAIKLLPLTNLELIEVIDEELSENPLLELEEEAVEKKPEEAAKEAEKEEEKNEPAEEPVPGEPGIEDVPDTPENQEELEFESYFQEYIDDGFRSLSHERREIPSLENTLSKSASLWDHLNWQANLTFFEPADQEIAQLIIGNINEDGYLTSSLSELAQAAQTTEEKIKEIREKIKMFDPVGVGSLDLKECLLAQMDFLQL